MLSKIVNDVETEPKLQPVTDDIIEGLINNMETGLELQPVTGEIIEELSGNASKPNIRAIGVWRADQNTFFDVRMINTHSPSQIRLTAESVLKMYEQQKKRNYNTYYEH